MDECFSMNFLISSGAEAKLVGAALTTSLNCSLAARAKFTSALSVARE